MYSSQVDRLLCDTDTLMKRTMVVAALFPYMFRIHVNVTSLREG